MDIRPRKGMRAEFSTYLFERCSECLLLGTTYSVCHFSANSAKRRNSRAFIIAAIVAPTGDCSIATTWDCLEPASAFGGFATPFANGTRAVAAPPDADGAAARFFADFDIDILRSVRGDTRRTTQAPR